MKKKYIAPQIIISHLHTEVFLRTCRRWFRRAELEIGICLEQGRVVNMEATI